MTDLHEAFRKDVLYEAVEKVDAGEGRGRAVFRRKCDEIPVA